MRQVIFKQLIITILAILPVAADAQETVQYQPVPLPGSQLRNFRSEVLERDLRIYVQLPLDYDPQREEPYPVMYVTDANRSFPMIANISTVLGFPPSGFPQVVVVGIAYDIESMADWAVWRTLDLTPTVHPETEQNWEGILSRLTGVENWNVRTGGAAGFLEFIISELVPFIESEYHVSSGDRALGGYSYGGLFTMFALFAQPDAFQRYFAGSPSIYYDSDVTFRMEEEFAAAHDDLPAKLFLSAGELEWDYMVSAVGRMDSLLRSRAYPNLEVSSHVFTGEEHRSAYPAAVMRAFEVLYGE